MDTAIFIAPLLAGLAGSVHCIAMCGGIVGALSAAQGAPRHRVIAIHPTRSTPGALLALAYNGGRIASYAAGGAVAGGLAGAGAAFVNVQPLQMAAFWMVNLTLLLLGLYLMELAPLVARAENAGRAVWRRVQPLAAPLLPMDSAPRAFALGAVWGWLPCGMVYGMLLLALASGSAAGGAAVMLAFGLGTLPAMLGAGLFGNWLRTRARSRALRIACGALIAAFAVYGIARAAAGVAPPWLLALCLPGVHP